MLDALLKPQTVAVVGASGDAARPGGRALRLLASRGFTGQIYPINPKYRELQGLPCCPSVSDVDGPIDAAVIALPAREVPSALRELVSKQCRAAVVLSSGFSEVGPEGARLEQEMLAIAQAGHLRLLGPNTLGLVNAFDRTVLSFGQYADADLPAGPLGLVSQSGAFGTAIVAAARARGLGVGYYIATGNEADIGFAEAMQTILEDSRIAVGLGYLEGIRDGAAFVALAERAAGLGKPVVVVKVGRSSAGARAAVSHTGALAGEDRVFEGVLRQTGVLRARDEEHMIDLAEVLASCGPPQGRGVGIVTMSGGAGILMADRAEELGLDLPELAPETRATLSAALPGFAASGNPVDVTGQVLGRPTLFRDALAAVLADPKIHIGVVWLQLLQDQADALAAAFEDAKATTDKPLVVSWIAAPESARARLRKSGIPVLRGGIPAIDGIAALVEVWQARRHRASSPPPRLPPVNLPAIRGIVPSIEAAQLFGDFGVPTARALLARTPDEAVAAADRLGFPVALKIESPDLAHKTEVDGVRLGVSDAADVREHSAALLADVARRRPNARLAGVIVQSMASGTVELVVGLQRDPVFGAVVMVGAGGVLVEILQDAVFRLAPIGTEEAGRMLDELRISRVLCGVRGRPAVDRSALARLISAVSILGAAAGPRLCELDLNPVLAGPDGVVAVDWLLALDDGAGP